MMAFYDQNGSLVMGPRTGTPMRLVSPAPQVLVPPGAARAPQAPPAIYPPQQAQQNHMNQSQNGYNVSGEFLGEYLFLLIKFLILFLL